MKIDTKTSPLVILGLEGGHLEQIQRWAQEGYLPTIASIMDRGCYSKIVSPEQIVEHGTQLSFFSSIPRNQHGYYHFRQLQSGSYNLRAFSAHEAKASPFWAYLKGQDIRVAVIDTAEIAPIEGVSGIQLANWAAHQPAFPPIQPSAEPAELLSDVRGTFGPQMSISEFKLNSSFQDDLQSYHLFLKRIEKKGALCLDLLRRGHFDVVVALFYESHTAAHRFWKYRPEAGGSGAVVEENELTHAIRNIYQAIERQMGQLLAHLPSEANVFVFSPFGMKDQYPTDGLIEAFCRQLGYQASPAPGGFSTNPLTLVRRWMPKTWRVRLSQALPTAIQEQLMADQLYNGTNWEQTSAFSTPSNYTSFVYVNLRGREPQGIVEPGAAYDALLDRLEADLQQLIDPQTGKPAVEKITRVSELYRSGPPTNLPDLFVEWRAGRHFMQRLVHPKAELVQLKPGYFRDSDHIHNGFVAAAGPSIIGRGPTGDVGVLDLAPTFLTLLGQPTPQEMSGKVIESMISIGLS